MRYYFAHQTLTCDELKGKLTCEFKPYLTLTMDLADSLSVIKRIGFVGDKDIYSIPNNKSFSGKGFVRINNAKNSRTVLIQESVRHYGEMMMEGVKIK